MFENGGIWESVVQLAASLGLDVRQLTLAGIVGFLVAAYKYLAPRQATYLFLRKFYRSRRLAVREWLLARVWWPFGDVKPIDRARLRAEYAILGKPLPPRPDIKHKDYQRLNWRERLANWRAHRKALREARAEWRKDRIVRRSDMAALEARYADKASMSKDNWEALDSRDFAATAPIIDIDTPAVLDKARDDIARYFNALKSLSVSRKEDCSSFLSYVKINDGYAASAFLIHGLMSRFDDDWQPIIRNYRKTLHQWAPSSGYSKELDELRSFQFNCWLLWGPSIPLCTCQTWQEPRVHEEAGGRNFIMQYGFGDEANCVDLLIDDDAARERYQAWLSRVQSTATMEPKHVGAIFGALYGQVMWGAYISRERICEAQRLAIVGNETQSGRVVLKFTKRLGGDAGAPEHTNYYSAYVWVMFAVTRRDGSCFHAHADGHRNLMPFFEHGNIADATTLQTIKENLVAKSLSALSEIVCRNGDRDVDIHYVCACDQSGCGSEILFPPSPPNPPEGVGHAEAYALRPPRIVDLLRDAADSHSLFMHPNFRSRLHLPDGTKDRTLDHGQYASCNLPKIIENFMRELEEMDTA